MRLFQLVREDWDYDEVIEMVVLASSELSARKLAVDFLKADKNYHPSHKWVKEFADIDKSTCIVVDSNRSGVVTYCVHHG